MSSWTYTELATAIGLRALGDDIETIANMLGRQPKDVGNTLRSARFMVDPRGWVGRQLPPDERAAPQDRIGPFEKRKWRISPHLDQIRAAQSRDLTARVLGDPSSERVATIAAQAAAPKPKVSLKEV